VASATPVLVQLRPNEGLAVDSQSLGNGVVVSRVRDEPEGGLLGHASENALVIEVAPPALLRFDDEHVATQVPAASNYRDTIRHELAHVASNLMGLPRSDWLREGLAHAVEWIPVEDGRLDLDPVPDVLRRAAAYVRRRGEIAPLLDWKQSIPPVDADNVMRATAFTLVTFLIERERPASVREALERIAALEPDRIRGLEGEWSAWLEGLASQAD
jgi:hypothetical protein